MSTDGPQSPGAGRPQEGDLGNDDPTLVEGGSLFGAGGASDWPVQGAAAVADVPVRSVLGSDEVPGGGQPFSAQALSAVGAPGATSSGFERVLDLVSAWRTWLVFGLAGVITASVAGVYLRQVDSESSSGALARRAVMPSVLAQATVSSNVVESAPSINQLQATDSSGGSTPTPGVVRPVPSSVAPTSTRPRGTSTSARPTPTSAAELTSSASSSTDPDSSSSIAQTASTAPSTPSVTESTDRPTPTTVSSNVSAGRGLSSTAETTTTARSVSTADSGVGPASSQQPIPTTSTSVAETTSTGNRAPSSATTKAPTTSQIESPKRQTRRIEAETGDFHGTATVRSDHEGFSGAGFVGDLYTRGSGVTLTVDVAETGMVPFTVGYSAGRGAGPASGRMLTVLLNEEPVVRAEMRVTKSWSDWDVVVGTLPLEAGANTITLVWARGDTGWVNVDYIEIN